MFLSVATVSQANLPPMSDDILDMRVQDSDFGKPVVVMNAGEIEKVIDHRGYMPISAFSKKQAQEKYVFDSKEKVTGVHVSGALHDEYGYFRLPIVRGLVWFLEGLSADNRAKCIIFTNRVKILKESQVNDDDSKWINLAQSLNQNGKAFFDALPGKLPGKLSARFDESDAVATVFYSEAVLVIVNIRYSTLLRNGSGQILLGYEFSRRLPSYRKLHLIRSLGGIQVGGNEPILAESIIPIVQVVVSKAFK